jgi:hypothetical protein
MSFATISAGAHVREDKLDDDKVEDDTIPAAYTFFVQKLLDTAKRQKKGVPENVYIQVWFEPVMKRFFREYRHCGSHVDSGLNPENELLKILGKNTAKCPPPAQGFVSIETVVSKRFSTSKKKNYDLVSLMEQRTILNTMKGIKYDQKTEEDESVFSQKFIGGDNFIAKFNFLFSCFINNLMAETANTKKHVKILRSIYQEGEDNLETKCNAIIIETNTYDSWQRETAAKISCEHLYTLMYVLARAAPFVSGKLNEEKKEELWDMFNAWSQILGGFHTLILKDTDKIGETACIHQFINLVRVHAEFLSQEYQQLLLT